MSLCLPIDSVHGKPCRETMQGSHDARLAAHPAWPYRFSTAIIHICSNYHSHMGATYGKQSAIRGAHEPSTRVRAYHVAVRVHGVSS